MLQLATKTVRHGPWSKSWFGSNITTALDIGPLSIYVEEGNGEPCGWIDNDTPVYWYDRRKWTIEFKFQWERPFRGERKMKKLTEARPAHSRLHKLGE